jgi:hypothetical protein
MHPYGQYAAVSANGRKANMPSMYSSSVSSSILSLSLLISPDTSCWLEFTDDEQLKISLLALDTSTLFNNCMKIFQHNNGERNYRVLTQFMNTCEDPNSFYRASLVQFDEYGTATFHELSDRLVNLVTSRMRYSEQSHLLAGHLCRLITRLCSRNDHRFPHFNEFGDVIKHLPILTNAVHLLYKEAKDNRLEEDKLRELLTSFFEHPLLSDFTLMNVGQSDLELPKLIAAEGALKTICAAVSLPGRHEFLRGLMMHLKGLRRVLDIRCRHELDQQIADSLSSSIQMNQKHLSTDPRRRALQSKHIHFICYELLTDDQCSRVIADVIHQLQHNA